jgi:factor associated with neutral sphingomyelinase activation
MGSTPEGELIDDVVLPKWANNSQDFLMKMRAAFEGDYVSSHINEWIDLIFGFKQNGTSAITFDNLFYHLTYQENVNFDRQMSRIERAALEVQISEFGQTPLQIFEDKHPLKKTRILSL